jgi:hypothetical protein
MDFEVFTMVPMWGAGSRKEGEGEGEDGLQFIIGSSPKKETIGIGVRFEHKILAPNFTQCERE